MTRDNGLEKETQRIERKYLPDFVYGGMEGAITTFSIISGVVGASLPSFTILALGFANLFADGFTTSIAHYFSIKSKNELVKKQEKHPAKGAIAKFFSFLIIGFIPLISFIIASVTKNPEMIQNQFVYSAILTGIALMIIGWFRGEVTGKHKVKSCIQTILIGGVAAFLAYFVGKLISVLVG